MKDRIANYIRAGYPGLYITSHEEQRVEAVMREAVVEVNKKHNDRPFVLHLWSCTEGLIEVGPDAEHDRSGPKLQEPMEMLEAFYKAPQKTIYLIRDFHLFLEDRNAMVWRKFKDALLQGKANNKALVILGCRFTVPPELEREIAVIEFSLPDREQLREVLHGLLQANGKDVSSLDGDEVGILSAAGGLTTTEAENAFALSVVERGKICREIVFREKCQAVKKNGLLEVVDSHVTLADIGGLDALKKWLLERRDAFSDEAKSYGLPTPRGFLAVGNPGTGKTLTAKACRSVFDVPLLRLDAAKLFGSLVGQTESNWRSVHATAKAMAPCILHIDEVDGAMSGGSSSGSTDGGTTSRVIKSILQDMQDNSEGIFYVLTANDVDNLPSPLLRRMDEVWNVELPNENERLAVWTIQIRKARRDPRKFDLPKLVKASEGYSGAEIEKLVAQSLYTAFADSHREPTTGDMLGLMETFMPMSKTMAADIARRTERLKGVAKLASGVAAAGNPDNRAPMAPKGTRKISFTKAA
jgi:ATP-dependent 26S proteasome regulatory subunit